MTVLCLGEAIVDMICEEPVESIGDAHSFRPHFGGAMANVALAIRRGGASAALAGGVGNDAWGAWLRARLEEEGVDLAWFGAAPCLGTPVAFVTFGHDGEPSFSVYGDGIRAGLLSLEGRIEEAVAGASALAFGSNTLVGRPERSLTLEARRLAAARGLPVCFDPNLRLQRWADVAEAIEVCRSCCEGALVRTNMEEAQRLTGQPDPAAAAESICEELGARLAVVTRGGEGGAVARGAAHADVPVEKVEVVNTLGAGDAFFGTLIAGLANRGWDLSAAAEEIPRAIKAASAVCRRVGAA